MENRKDYRFVIQAILFMISIAGYSYTGSVWFLAIAAFIFFFRMAVYSFVFATALNVDLLEDNKTKIAREYRNPLLRLMVQIISACSIMQFYYAGYVLFAGASILMLVLEFVENLISWMLIKTER